MKITMLGTGNALVTKCFNTCFVISDGEKRLLVDGGGGNGVLTRLREAGIDWKDVHDIIVTHKHLDHIMGIIWMVRMICQHMRQGEYDGEARIYAHAELIDMLRGISGMLIQKKDLRFIDERLFLIPVTDGEKREIIGHDVRFFDIHSDKAKQYGFTLAINGGKALVCCGDEPLNQSDFALAENCEWLLHEAFCLYSQADVFHPYEKNHSTVADACKTASALKAKKLLLYHTEDSDLENRKRNYISEGERYFGGEIYVPDDLETVEL